MTTPLPLYVNLEAGLLLPTHFDDSATACAALKRYAPGAGHRRRPRRVGRAPRATSSCRTSAIAVTRVTGFGDTFKTGRTSRQFGRA
jgi:hypothetical protein